MKFQHQEDHQQQQQNIIKRTSKLELNQINGLRPMQLQVHKNSHIIHKHKYSSATSSSATTAACSSSSTTISNKQNNRNGPVIIYTHSPKVIHTQPHDFMALVQKLTGSKNISNNVKQSNEVVNESVCDEVGDKVIKDLSDKFVGNDNRRFLYEIPLFTPIGLDLGHDQQQFRFEGESIFSPATLEFLKPLPEC